MRLSDLFSQYTVTNQQANGTPRYVETPGIQGVYPSPNQRSVPNDMFDASAAGRWAHRNPFNRPSKTTFVNEERRRLHDPSVGVSGMPPNYGNPIVPHVQSFQGFVSSVSHAYRPSDEALLHSRENAKYMRNDPTVMGPLESRQLSTAMLNWHLTVPDKHSQDQQELAAALTKMLEEIPWFTEYRRVMLEALWYGRQGITLTWNWDWIDGRKRLIPQHWVPLHGDKLVFRFDSGNRRFTQGQVGIKVGLQWGHTDLAGYRQPEPTEFGLAYFLEDWERQYYCLHHHMREDGPYEEPGQAGSIFGIGIRSRIYWLHYQKQETLAMMMELMERTGLGFNIWYYPANNEQARKDTETAAKEQTQQNSILVPKMPGDPAYDAYGFDRIEPSGQGIETMRVLLDEYFGNLILRYILGQTLSSKADATGLGSGLSDLHFESLMRIIKYDAVMLEESITRELVTPLKDFNFKHARDIKVKFKIDTESAQAEQKLNAVRQLFEMGGDITKGDVYDLVGVSQPTEDDETLSMAALQGMAQQAMPGEQPGMQDMEQAIANEPVPQESQLAYVPQDLAEAEAGGSLIEQMGAMMA